MVFGESVINDAVAIVLFESGNEVLKTGKDFVPMDCAQDVLRLLLGSVLIGALAGCGMYTRLRFLGLRAVNSVSSQLKYMSYMVYALAEALHFSGIIAALFCGIFLGVVQKPR